MSELPPEYTEVINKIKSFRSKIFDTIVSGRVKAVLDANHETLNKYKSIVEGLSIMPYMIDVLTRKALAFRFGDTDIGSGKIAQSKVRYNAGLALYPIFSPPKVPLRSLPQVDVFVYTPPSDLELVEKGNEKLWGNLFVIQCDRHKFVEVPDVSNVSFDFYTMRPVARGRFKAELLYPQTGFDTWQYVYGEMVILHRALTPVGSDMAYDYFIFVFVDGNVSTSTGEVNIIPLIIIVTRSTANNPKVVLVCGGQRLLNTDEGVFCGWVAEGQFVGFTKTHGGHNPVSYDEIWYGTSKFDLRVNNPAYGTTNPSPKVYTKKTTDITTVYAMPNSGYSLKCWDLDGVDFPPSSSFSLYHFRDHILTCVFYKGGTVTIRPNANGDVIQNEAYGDYPNYKCVDDIYSDGDATIVMPMIADDYARDLYQMSDVSLPSGSVIDSLTLGARVRWVKQMLVPVYARIVLKTYGRVYTGDWVKAENDWKLITWFLEKNPYTNNNWTQSEINNLQVGVDLQLRVDKVTGYFSKAVCTQVYGDVEWHG